MAWGMPKQICIDITLGSHIVQEEPHILDFGLCVCRLQWNQMQFSFVACGNGA